MEHHRIITLLLSSIFIFMMCFAGTWCDCTSADAEITNFVMIDPAKYDKNYSSIASSNARPYGFQKAIWYYDNSGKDNPCVKVDGASKRRVEVMIETVPQDRLCVKNQNRNLGCSDSGTGRLYSCKRAQTDSLTFEFYSEGIENDVQFWYRIVLGDTPDDDPEDHWCDDRSHDEYPQNLLQLPLDYTFPSDTTTPLNGAPQALSNWVHFMLNGFLCSIGMMFFYL